MVSDLSPDFAEDIADWMSQGDDLATAPTDLYVTVYDDTETELDGSFSEARQSVDTAGGWLKTNSSFENDETVSLGEATEDVDNVQYVGLWDSETDGDELARYEIDELGSGASSVPFDVGEGTELLFEAGELSFDVLDYDDE